jgi:hypothetical protein
MSSFPNSTLGIIYCDRIITLAVARVLKLGARLTLLDKRRKKSACKSSRKFVPILGSDTISCVSARPRRFTFVRLINTYLTGFPRLFLARSPPSLFTAAAQGDLQVPTNGRLQGAFPHLGYNMQPLSFLSFGCFVAQGRGTPIIPYAAPYRSQTPRSQ